MHSPLTPRKRKIDDRDRNDPVEAIISSLETRWNLEHDGSTMDEADRAYEQIRQMFYAARSKLEEAIALFRATAPDCKGDKRAALLLDILQHVRKGLPLEEWRTSVVGKLTFGRDQDVAESSGTNGVNIPVESASSMVQLRSPKPPDIHSSRNLVSPNFPKSTNAPIPLSDLSRLPDSRYISSTIEASAATQDWKSILQNFQTLQQSMHEGADQLTYEQVRFIADQSAQMMHISQTVLRKRPYYAGGLCDCPQPSTNCTTCHRPIRHITKPSTPTGLIDTESTASGAYFDLMKTPPYRAQDEQEASNISPRLTMDIQPTKLRELHMDLFRTPHMPITGQISDSGYGSEHGSLRSRQYNPLKPLPTLTEHTVPTKGPQEPPVESGGLEFAEDSRGEGAVSLSPKLVPLELQPTKTPLQSIPRPDFLGQFDFDSFLHNEHKSFSIPPYVISITERFAERRRIQNRIAQRNYRKKLKARLDDLERRAAEVDSSTDKPDDDLAENVVDPEVLSYQDSHEAVVIQCVCENTNDHRFIIPCITCGTWQHISCFYELAQDVVENHECAQCNAKDWNDREQQKSKRSAQEALQSDTASSAESFKRPKTLGAESSGDHSGYSQSLSTLKSNYQNVLGGKPNSTSAYRTLTSQRTSHKIAEQGRRNRINVALEKMQALLPPSWKQHSEESTAAVMGTGSSKASTVESAIEYIRDLHRQIEEKDKLLRPYLNPKPMTLDNAPVARTIIVSSPHAHIINLLLTLSRTTQQTAP